MIIIGGPASNGLEESIGRELHAKSVRAEHKLFPDGESHVKIPCPLKGEDAVLVQSTYAPQDKHLMELFLMADTARSMGAASITAVVPYLAYLRQDRKFNEGEAVSSETVLKLLNALDVSKLVVVQPHKTAPFSAFRGEAVFVDPIPMQADAIMESIDDPVVLAPDKGGIGRAEELASIFECEYSHIEKQRNVDTGSVNMVAPLQGSFDGKTVLIADDIISTGNTMALGAKEVLAKGATKVIAVATHLIMVDDAYDKLIKAGVSEIYGTNTVPYSGAKILDIGAEIAAVL